MRNALAKLTLCTSKYVKNEIVNPCKQVFNFSYYKIKEKRCPFIYGRAAFFCRVSRVVFISVRET